MLSWDLWCLCCFFKQKTAYEMRISDWSSDVCSSDLESIDFLGIWNAQKVDPVLESAIAVVSGVVNDDIIRPPQGISNISEWCKKEACWTRIQARTDAIANLLPQIGRAHD